MRDKEKRETPQERWNRKNGYTTKGFRMYKSLADRFVAACEKAGRSQASVIQELMEGFIAEQEKEHPDD